MMKKPHAPGRWIYLDTLHALIMTNTVCKHQYNMIHPNALTRKCIQSCSLCIFASSSAFLSRRNFSAVLVCWIFVGIFPVLSVLCSLRFCCIPVHSRGVLKKRLACCLVDVVWQVDSGIRMSSISFKISLFWVI